MFMELTGAAGEIARLLETHKPAADDVEGIRTLSRAMRQTVESKPLPPEMADTLLSYYSQLCDRAMCSGCGCVHPVRRGSEPSRPVRDLSQRKR